MPPSTAYPYLPDLNLSVPYAAECVWERGWGAEPAVPVYDGGKVDLDGVGFVDYCRYCGGWDWSA